MNLTHPTSGAFRKTLTARRRHRPHRPAVPAAIRKGIDTNIGTMAGAPSTTTGRQRTHRRHHRRSPRHRPRSVRRPQLAHLRTPTPSPSMASATFAVNGTQTVSPANSTNFHLVGARAPAATTEASVRVTVRVPTAPTVTT